jgi:hypothetical protein
MSNDVKKTLAFVVVALVLTGAAVVRMPDRSGSSLDFKDQGEEFFPNFKEPLACTDLEVVDYDPSTASSTEFKVMFRDGRWVIPSHHNYPADAKDRLAKTAAGVTDLRKDTVRSDSVAQHEAFGVIDPLDSKAGLKGIGKRVTLRDKSGNPLADFIIGKEVSDKPSQRYVRVPTKNRVYGVNVKVDLSTRFADWIETNLLKIDASHIRSIKFDNYKVDPERRAIIPGKPFTIDRKDGFAPWNIEGGVPEGQEPNTEKLTALTSALADLKIVGVRPKPEGLSRELKMAPTNELNLDKLTNLIARSLVSKGFYPTKDGLYSNQGEVVVTTDEGAVYTLRFGEVYFGAGEDLTAGTKEEESKEPGKETDKDKKAGKADGTTESRYLMVTVAFDPKLVPEPAKPKEDLVMPDDPFQKAADDPKRIADEKAAQEKADREKSARDKQLADAEKKVKDLSDRFADWYYLTPGDSFRSIVLDRASLVRPKSDKPAAAPGPGAMPGFPTGFPDHP